MRQDKYKNITLEDVTKIETFVSSPAFLDQVEKLKQLEEEHSQYSGILGKTLLFCGIIVIIGIIALNWGDMIKQGFIAFWGNADIISRVTK